MVWKKIKPTTLTGTAVLGALVVVFDYTLKFSGLKINFPLLPFLKFDFTGVPIVLSLLLYGLPSGGVTSIIAFLAILVRSGDFIGSLMKGLAEFSTILGMMWGLRSPEKSRKLLSFVVGIISRCVVMSLVNLIVFPRFYGMPLTVAISLLPLLGIFNAMHGALSILVGSFVYQALMRRVPSLVKPIQITSSVKASLKQSRKNAR